MDSIFHKRISTRNFSAKPVMRGQIESVLCAGLTAPSGKNGQPWRFVVVHEDRALLSQLSACTVYEPFVKQAGALIAVFLDKKESYHYIKDCQAIGACIQNMLLEAAAQQLGACWIGEILNRDAQAKKLLGIDNGYDLMAVIALGYAEGETQRAEKKTLQQCLIKYL